MNFFELKQELAARGAAHESQQRLGQWVNRARARLDNSQSWPYRLTTTTTLTPIADMGQVDLVTVGTVPLLESTYDDLFGEEFDPTTTGTATYWYRTALGVATYPVGTATATVRYWKRTPVLTETDSPASPGDYHMLIVDMADQMAKRDAGNYEAAAALQPEIDRQLGEMVDDLLGQYEPTLMRMTGASDDG